MRHSGAISKITTSTITVSLEGNVNCEGCKAKAACGISESNSKEIEIENPHMIDTDSAEPFQINEQVDVIMQEELGLKAVFWAYVFPFILLISVLLIASVFFTEWQAGLLALAVLGPYYVSLHYLNSFFKKKFKVSILKMI
jgi:sigma-E factor negative regulatory protein RseC